MFFLSYLVYARYLIFFSSECLIQCIRKCDLQFRILKQLPKNRIQLQANATLNELD